MQLSRPAPRALLLLFTGLLCVASPVAEEPRTSEIAREPAPPQTPPGGIDVDFLFNYYDQDGDNSPVTGGIGTEELEVVSPVVLVRWAVNENWVLNADVGVDSITSASTGYIDGHVSGASTQDNRVFLTVGATRIFETQSLTVTGGFSGEYDYTSVQAGVAWSVDLNQRNTTLSAGLKYFSDTVDLIDIDGRNRGQDDRTTTDLRLGLTQVLGRSTVGIFEANYTSQSGFLSTPFHEVILSPAASFPRGEHVAERLPDSRARLAVGAGLNHAFTERIVQRLRYRYYDDDWGIAAHTIDSETHFRLPTRTEIWLYPILRYHTQGESDYYGAPGTFSGMEDYFTADGDLGEFDSTKVGIGARALLEWKPSGFWGRLRSIDFRATSYSREDGLDALTIGLGLGWSF